MGNNQSKSKNPECPFTVLELDPSSAPDVIKRHYHKLLLKYHPDRNKNVDPQKVLQIKDAYEKVKDGNYKVVITPPDLSKYTKQYFSLFAGDSFYKEVNKIYQTINKYESERLKNIKWPRFGNASTTMTPTSLFYVFYRSYKHEGFFGEEVKRLTNVVQSIDPRLKKTVYECVKKTTVVVKEKVVKKRHKKPADKYVFYCDACQKGFMSDKTMENHVKGEKHKVKMVELGLEDINLDELRDITSKKIDRSVDVMRESVNEEDKEAVVITEKEYEQECKDAAEKEPDIKIDITSNNAQQKQKTTMKCKKKKKKVDYKENLNSLTCSICKQTFESRNKLFDHIRSEHVKL